MPYPRGSFPLGNFGSPAWRFAAEAGGALPGAYGCGLLAATEGSRFGGCVRVGPGWILTAHHLIDIADLAFRFRATFGWVDRDSPRTVYELDTRDFFHSDDGIQGPVGYGFQLDYAFIRLKAPKDDPSTQHPPTCTPAPMPVQAPVCIPQHRSRGPMQVATENSIEFPDVGKVVHVTADFIFHRASTYRGSSGSPIFDDRWRLAGLHTHGFIPSSSDPWVKSANRGSAIGAIVRDARARNFAFLAEMPVLQGL